MQLYKFSSMMINLVAKLVILKIRNFGSFENFGSKIGVKTDDNRSAQLAIRVGNCILCLKRFSRD
ncbi:MAG: hypothetical protein EB150_01685 [Nitrososphaeria archaeon]|nr:hypothetical protein [Nitrosopumilaceae archaeon]NDB91469.1 hypothetical protein [Nitrososphaeria archaeon]NDF28910.1 hypothetical protein [Nitrososphaeria archaeon]NDF34644.1 hypothetical protein [Nitrosopumilaceae archaeon]